MTQSFYTHAVNSYGRGFFADAIPRSDESFQANELAPLWMEWEDIFECAKQGDFSRTPRLLQLLGTMDSTLDGSITELLAFAGSSRALEEAADELAGDGRLEHIGLCQALASSGELRFVESVVDAYVRLERDGWLELEMIPVELRYSLGDPQGSFHDGVPIPEFAARVMARHQALVHHHGSDATCVFDGAKVSPARFARELRRRAGLGEFAMLAPLRCRFEAYTGIDCRRFYDESRRPQTLDIAVTTEEFLARPMASAFTEGRRYFFGHRVP